MKRRLTVCTIATALLLAGCADPLEQTSPQDVQNQIQRGVTGQGHLIDSESINNPTGASAATQGQPQPPPP